MRICNSVQQCTLYIKCGRMSDWGLMINWCKKYVYTKSSTTNGGTYRRTFRTQRNFLDRKKVEPYVG